MPTKRVLIVSFYWPPSGGGGVQRWLKFAKLLPEHGWEPVVVTPSNPDVPVLDPSLAEDVLDGVEVWDFPVWEPSRFLRRMGLGGGTSRLGADSRASTSRLSRFVRWVRGNLFVPDARIGWVRPTTQK
ncbi:MAG: glycosyl transferase family 1, partial [Flavobacteriales bacterium]